MQFPTEFEFNMKYLLTLLDHVWSGRFGTFFLNSIRERIQFCLKQRTVSLWTYMRTPESRMIFTNFLFEPSDHVLYPSSSTSKVRLWEEFWLRSGLVEYPRPLRLDALPPRAAHPISTSTEMIYQMTISNLKSQIAHLTQAVELLRAGIESEGDDIIDEISLADQMTHYRRETHTPQQTSTEVSTLILDRLITKDAAAQSRQPAHSINI